MLELGLFNNLLDLGAYLPGLLRVRLFQELTTGAQRLVLLLEFCDSLSLKPLRTRFEDAVLVDGADGLATHGAPWRAFFTLAVHLEGSVLFVRIEEASFRNFRVLGIVDFHGGTTYMIYMYSTAILWLMQAKNY